MAKKRSQASTVILVVGGDEYLNHRNVREAEHRACVARPDAEVIELDAADCDSYSFDEAVSPTLLSDVSIVVLRNLQRAGEALGKALETFCVEATRHPQDSSVVICQHEGGNKGKRLISTLKNKGAEVVMVPDLKKFDAKINFVYSLFEQQQRHIELSAAQQLVNVLGERTGELASMCSQLCFDFDEDPISRATADSYLISDPQVTGFAVADKAVAGDVTGAVLGLRAAIEQGVAPLALIGALGLKLRTMAKASAIRHGTISQAEAKASPWQLRAAGRELSGWSSEGLGRCIESLAWADEQCKSNGGDPVYALERAIGAISAKGREIHGVGDSRNQGRYRS
ncbi:DNA polymerase III subunit delta [Bifidobacterium aquikefiri]|uniref:DNA polymerase III subunit delta n=1 Tax=Bifidobacterium aquikefiri TaxID=1653207 RepID=UPI0039E7C1B7